MHRTLPNPDTHPPITPEHTGSQHLPRKSVAVADWRALRSVWLTQLEAKAAVETPRAVTTWVWCLQFAQSTPAKIHPLGYLQLGAVQGPN